MASNATKTQSPRAASITPSKTSTIASKSTTMPTTQKQSMSSQQSVGRASIQPKTPLELNYMRRIYLREQKRLMIIRKLQEELPQMYILSHSALLVAMSLIFIGIQIALIVYKSTLYFILSGFWCAGLYLFSVFLQYMLGKLLVSFRSRF
jgi:hypothetical protein